MWVRGPGERLTSVGVNATLAAQPGAVSFERSQIVSLTLDDSYLRRAALRCFIAVADRGESALT